MSIYLDNAATSHPKPEGVVRAAENGHVTVRFDGAGDRTFSAAWVAANCQGL